MEGLHGQAGGVAAAAIMMFLVVLAVAIIFLAVFALVKLKRAPIDEIARVLWAFLVVSLPVCGPITLFIVDPGSAKHDTSGGPGSAA